MEGKPVVGIRYCGGCNPRYDRVSLVKRLMSFFPDVSFVPAQKATAYQAVLVVHGCPSRCADVSGLAVAPGGMIALCGFEDLLAAREKLKLALRSQQARSLDHSQVMDILPHREPLLLIDTVSHLLPGVEARASFHVSEDLPVFAGHFPGEAVLPGIYTVEAAAQAAGILMMTTRRYEGKLPLFAGIRQARFLRKVLPGQTLEIHASLLEERAEAGAATCLGQVFVNGELVTDVEVRLAFR